MHNREQSADNALRCDSLNDLREQLTEKQPSQVEILNFSSRRKNRATIDCSELSQLKIPPLEALAFYNCKIDNINSIDALDPESLAIRGCTFKEPIPFSSLHRLRELSLDCVNRDEFRELSEAKALTNLQLARYKSPSLSSSTLSSDSVTHLEIRDGNFQDFSCFSFPNLVHLSLGRCRNISSFNGLEAIARLEDLSIVCTLGTQDLDRLGDLKELRYLIIGGNSKISSLSFVERLPELKRICLTEKVEVLDGDLGPLQRHPGLEVTALSFKKHYYPLASEIPSWTN